MLYRARLVAGWGGCAVILNVDRFEKIEVCGICGEDIIGYGNNADPIKCGLVCDDCNIDYVIPIRIFLSGLIDDKVLLIKTNCDLDFVEIDSKNSLKELQRLVAWLIEIYPKKDDKFFYIVDEEGICKCKEYNFLAKVIFDIDIVGDLVVCVKKLIE